MKSHTNIAYMQNKIVSLQSIER